MVSLLRAASSRVGGPKESVLDVAKDSNLSTGEILSALLVAASSPTPPVAAAGAAAGAPPISSPTEACLSSRKGRSRDVYDMEAGSTLLPKGGVTL